MIVRKTDGCTITAKEEETGIAVQIWRNDPDGDVKLGEVLVESFEGLRKIHIFLGDDDDSCESIDLETEQ